MRPGFVGASVLAIALGLACGGGSSSGVDAGPSAPPIVNPNEAAAQADGTCKGLVSKNQPGYADGPCAGLPVGTGGSGAACKSACDCAPACCACTSGTVNARWSAAACQQGVCRDDAAACALTKNDAVFCTP